MKKEDTSPLFKTSESEDRYTFMHRMLYGEWDSPDVADSASPAPEPLDRRTIPQDDE